MSKLYKISGTEITVSPGQISNTVYAPPSKSVMQRIIAAAILSEDKTTILNPSFCNDCKTAVNIAEKLGAEIITNKNKIEIFPRKNKAATDINCGESGLAIRMFAPITAHFGNKFILNGEGSLKKRPLKEIEETLNQLNLDCRTNNGFLPVRISGNIKGGKIETDGSESSQLLTGLLISLPALNEDSEINVKNLKSKPYIDLTLEVLKKFGIEIKNINYEKFTIKGRQKFKAQTVTTEGDWSAAAFLAVAGLISGEITIKGLDVFSAQADKKIINAIHAAGGKISVTEDKIICKKSNLKAFQFDASDSPDLFPPLAVMATYAKGTSLLKGVNRLIHKESNRAETLKTEFAKIGINIIIDKDLMLIEGGKISGGITDSHNDHRIAMALAVAALGSKNGITIKNAFSINKSYPGFYEDLLK
ncbi:MAG: 3-phosphoshikimate 1-carboxyvinyltransferase [Chlorobi bacterium]|nr:3-phosphoshikimate 1-carboxyvinyltransferase [Chlorobiota bacterium]